MTAVNGKVQRKNVSVLLLDGDGITEKLRWNLIMAWPSKWKGTPLNALGTETAIEEMTICYEQLQRG